MFLLLKFNQKNLKNYIINGINLLYDSLLKMNKKILFQKKHLFKILFRINTKNITIQNIICKYNHLLPKKHLYFLKNNPILL